MVLHRPVEPAGLIRMWLPKVLTNSELQALQCATMRPQPSQMTPRPALSQYSKNCPACGAIIRPSELPYVRRDDGFPCTSCGERLMYDNPNSLAIWVTSILIAIVGTLHLGYRDAMFILIAPCATLVLVFLRHFVVGTLLPPPLKRVESKSKTFDNAGSLHLTDKSNGDKKANH